MPSEIPPPNSAESVLDMVQTDDGPLPTMVILRLTVEPWRLFVQEKNLEGEQVEWLSHQRSNNQLRWQQLVSFRARSWHTPARRCSTPRCGRQCLLSQRRCRIRTSRSASALRCSHCFSHCLDADFTVCADFSLLSLSYSPLLFPSSA